ncbi:hypothetical protein RND81_04G014800 [Saponaria officinalis]
MKAIELHDFVHCQSIMHTIKLACSSIQIPLDLIIDHSVQVDVATSKNDVQKKMELEFRRSEERFGFLKWGSTAFSNMLVVPLGYGIVHQHNGIVNSFETGFLNNIHWVLEGKVNINIMVAALECKDLLKRLEKRMEADKDLSECIPQCWSKWSCSHGQH